MKKLFLLIISFLLLISCKITSSDPNNDLPDDANFNIIDSVDPIERAYNLTIDNKLLFVSDGSSRISVIDAFVPWNLDRLSTCIINSSSDERIYQSIRDSRNYLFCTNGNNGMYAVNSSNPLALDVDNHNTNLNPVSLDYYEGNNQELLAVTDENSWKLLKITSAGQTIQLHSHSYFTNRVVNKIKISYPYVFVGTDQSIDIFDISNPDNPSPVNTVTISNFRNFQIIGGYLVAITTDNLIFYNVTDPAGMFITQKYELPYAPTSFIIHDGKLLIGYENKKLVYYEIASLNTIVEIASKEFNDYIFDIDYSDNYYYLCCGTDGVICLDVLSSKKGIKPLVSSNE